MIIAHFFRRSLHRSRRWLAAAVALGVAAAGEAAYFNDEGQQRLQVETTIATALQLEVYGCSATYTPVPAGEGVTIVAGPGEQVGDAVTVGYCYEVAVRTQVTATPDYQAVGGIGGSTTNASCTGTFPPVPQWTNDTPARILLNPGAAQQVVASYGPVTVRDGAAHASGVRCGSFPARIGDVIGPDLAVFAGVSGPGAATTTRVDGEFRLQLTLPPPPPPPVPTLGEWARTGLALLVAAAAALQFRRRRRSL